MFVSFVWIAFYPGLFWASAHWNSFGIVGVCLGFWLKVREISAIKTHFSIYYYNYIIIIIIIVFIDSLICFFNCIKSSMAFMDGLDILFVFKLFFNYSSIFVCLFRLHWFSRWNFLRLNTFLDERWIVMVCFSSFRVLLKVREISAIKTLIYFYYRNYRQFSLFFKCMKSSRAFMDGLEMFLVFKMFLN